MSIFIKWLLAMQIGCLSLFIVICVNFFGKAWQATLDSVETNKMRLINNLKK